MHTHTHTHTQCERERERERAKILQTSVERANMHCYRIECTRSFDKGLASVEGQGSLTEFKGSVKLTSLS
jgi:hypothetical protein